MTNYNTLVYQKQLYRQIWATKWHSQKALPAMYIPFSSYHHNRFVYLAIYLSFPRQEKKLQLHACYIDNSHPCDKILFFMNAISIHIGPSASGCTYNSVQVQRQFVRENLTKQNQ